MATPNYLLTDLQSEAFTTNDGDPMYCDLYKPAPNAIREGTTKTLSGVYYVHAYTQVPCRFGQTPAVAQASSIGAIDEYMVFTYDVLRLNIAQECDDRWFAYDPQFDQWYAIKGTAQNRHFRAQEALYKCARAEQSPIYQDMVMVDGVPMPPT